MTHIIEYKSMRYPYHYEFLRKKNGDYAEFDTLQSARKKGIALIEDGTAVLSVIRGGVEQLVYFSDQGYVLENRTNNTWYILDKNGKLGRRLRILPKLKRTAY